MAKKHDRFGINQLMTAAADLSNFAVATAEASIVPPVNYYPSAVSNNVSKWLNDLSTLDKYNWLLHRMYSRSEYDHIQQFIRIQTYKNNYMTYMQGLTYRQEGRVVDALECFQKCAIENPSLTNIKQVAKTLSLLKRYRLAIDAYNEALLFTTNDWEVFHNLGLCYLRLNELKQAKQYFLQALQVTDIQEASFLELGKVYLLQGEPNEAEAIYEQGVRRNPESVELFTQLGLRAFEVKIEIISF